MAATSQVLTRLRELVTQLGPTLPDEVVQLLQGISDGLEEKEKDFRVAAEIGQMLVEKNKQLIEQNADLEASCQAQLAKKDAELRSAEQKQKILTKQIDELQARSGEEISKLEGKATELRTQLKESLSYKSKTHQLFDELQEKKTSLESEEQEKESLKRENARLRQELSKELSGQAAELQAEVNRLRTELESAHHGDVALKKAQKESMQLRAENIDLKEKLHEKENMQELIDSVMNVSREHKEREAEYKRLLTEARAQTELLQAELDDLRAGRTPAPRSLADELQPPPALSLADELGALDSPVAPPAAAAAAAAAAAEPVQEKVVERTRLIELLAQLRSQSNELAISLATVDSELQADKKVLDSLQRRVVAVNQQITQADEFVEPSLTDDAKALLSQHQAFLARELKESLDKHAAAENKYQEKMQQAQFLREKHTELEDRIRTLQHALDTHEGDVALSEKLLRDESHEALVKEVIRLRSEFKRARQEEEAYIKRLVELRRRLSAADAKKAGSGRGVNPRDTVALCAIAGDSVIRDTKNLNITRDKVLLWHATDLLLECAVLRLRLNEAELPPITPKDEQKQKPLPATPQRPAPAPVSSSPTQTSPFKRVMGLFGSSSQKTQEMTPISSTSPSAHHESL